MTKRKVMRSRRCATCGWCLYDGAWGQNPRCWCSGNRLREDQIVLASNKEYNRMIRRWPR